MGKQTKLKIGILTHNYPVSSKESKDAGKFVYAFCHELVKKADVFVSCPDYAGKKEKDKKVPVTWFDWRGPKEKFGSWGLMSPLSLLKFVKLIYFGNKEVISFVKKNRIDYLLCFWNFPSGIFGWYANKRLGVKYSTWALGSDIYIYPKIPIARQIIQIVLKGADKRFGNSYNINKVIERLSNKKAKFLPTSNLIVLSSYKKPKISKKKYNFITIARLEKVKGVDVLVEAANLLKKKRSDFTVTSIGAGSMFDLLQEKVKECGLSDNIKILGYVEDQSIVNGFLKDSDCLIIPSRSESFPLVVTEALQTNLPMIGANVGDMPDFIGKNKLGLIFEKENSKDLARKMEIMMKKGKMMKKKNVRLMRRLSGQFKLDNIVDNFLKSIATPINR